MSMVLHPKKLLPSIISLEGYSMVVISFEIINMLGLSYITKGIWHETSITKLHRNTLQSL